MVMIEAFEHGGRVVALVAGGRALIGDELAGRALALVRAESRYALEVQAGEQPDPYNDHAAIRSARRALARAHTARARGRPRR